MDIYSYFYIHLSSTLFELNPKAFTYCMVPSHLSHMNKEYLLFNLRKGARFKSQILTKSLRIPNSQRQQMERMDLLGTCSSLLVVTAQVWPGSHAAIRMVLINLFHSDMPWSAIRWEWSACDSDCLWLLSPCKVAPVMELRCFASKGAVLDNADP